MTRSEHLIASVHPALLLDPAAETALTFSPSESGALLVDDTHLTIINSIGTAARWELTAHTIAQLAAVLPGWCSASYNPAWGGVGAQALVPTRGPVVLEAGGAYAHGAYTSTLWRVLRPVAAGLAGVAEEARHTTLQTNLAVATGRWLDLWGSVWDIPRLAGEADSNYRRRMIALITSPKSSGAALEAIINTVFQVDAKITDGIGGGDTLVLNEDPSTWGPGGDSTLGPTAYGGFVVRIGAAVDDATLQAIIALVRANKAVGVTFSTETLSAYIGTLPLAACAAEWE